VDLASQCFLRGLGQQKVACQIEYEQQKQIIGRPSHGQDTRRLPIELRFEGKRRPIRLGLGVRLDPRGDSDLRPLRSGRSGKQ
jgi:hypothetical protein